MCLVLTVSEGFALKGGPIYPVAKNVVGTYSGVMTPTDASNTLGIFTVGIPDAGLATGTITIFTGIRTFVGTIRGFGNPETGIFRGAIQAIPVVTAGTSTVTTLNEHADGILAATVEAGKTTFLGLADTRLAGSAFITTTIGSSLTFTSFAVEAFKQSNTANTSTSSTTSG